MPPARKKSSRRRHQRSLKSYTHTGRRYVENGRVRIEWREDGRRRTRTIGVDSPDTRSAADAELDRTLRWLDEAEGGRPAATGGQPTSIGDALRVTALALIDVADALVDEVLGRESPRPRGPREGAALPPQGDASSGAASVDDIRV